MEARTMKLSEIGISKFLRVAGVLTILGLIVEIVSLLRVHPLMFALFAFVGVFLIGLGILVYLASLVFAAGTPQKGDSPR